MNTREKIFQVKKWIKYYAKGIDNLDRLLTLVEETLYNYPETRTIVVRKVEIVNRRNSLPHVVTLDDVLKEWSVDDQVCKDLVMSKRRIADSIRMKESFIKFAYLKGYGVTEIGRFMGVNHATIIHHLKKDVVASDTRVDSTGKLVVL